MKTKQCTRCRRWLSLNHFHKYKSRSDGHHYYCKECVNTYQKSRREQSLKDQLDMIPDISLIDEISDLLDYYNFGVENCTPNYILAEYLVNCLLSFNKALKQRQNYDIPGWSNIKVIQEDEFPDVSFVMALKALISLSLKDASDYAKLLAEYVNHCRKTYSQFIKIYDEKR